MQIVAMMVVLALGQAVHPGVLSKSDSRKLVREAEKQLTAFIRSLPEPVRRPLMGVGMEQRERYLEHRGSPLVGRICEFRCRWEFVTLATDMISKKSDRSEFVPTPPAREEHEIADTRRVLTASIPASLIRLYSFGAMFPDQQSPRGARRTGRRSKAAEKAAIEAQRRAKTAHARKIAEHDSGVREMRHQLRLMIPPRAKLPDADPPRSFSAIVKIKSIEFDPQAKIPTMIIHASLILSADLGIGP